MNQESNKPEENKEELADEVKEVEETEEKTEETAETPVEETVQEEPKAKKASKKEEKKEERCKKLEEQLKDEQTKLLYLRAEYDNYRKRTSSERDRIYADVKASTLEKMFPVYDNLELALKQETTDEAYRKGVEMIKQQFDDCLKALGVTPIEAVGQTFDPAMHNAVMHIEDPEKGEGEVVQEFQKGFKLGDKVIRFSMVQVAN